MADIVNNDLDRDEQYSSDSKTLITEGFMAMMSRAVPKKTWTNRFEVSLVLSSPKKCFIMC